MSSLYDPNTPPPHDDPPRVAEPGWTAHKAWTGALVGALTMALPALVLALDDGAITGAEWLGILVAALGVPATGGAVYQVRNRPKTGVHAH